MNRHWTEYVPFFLLVPYWMAEATTRYLSWIFLPQALVERVPWLYRDSPYDFEYPDELIEKKVRK